jgi:hypothetical protein
VGAAKARIGDTVNGMKQQDNSGADQAPGLRQTISSVLAAAFGVQSSANRQRDFRHGKALHFIVAGAVFTALFVLSLIVIVRLVLRHAGM